ncbi:SLAF1 protein, partial [Rhinopomastus cyanomelas]|nr:SLAF1 protein [Rhinopomastus cyanomelas]
EDPQTKFVLHTYSHGNATSYLEGHTCFRKSDFSLEIRSTRWQDGQLYEYIVSEGPKEMIWQVRLEVYEPVSSPTIKILSRALANGSCTLTLNCSVEREDRVSYSWGCQDSSAAALCHHNGSLLHLSYPTEPETITCSCTASNPISSRVATFNSSECSSEHAGRAPVAALALSILLLLLLLLLP